ncbi:hypothetical protein BZA70DRAFT_7319 [Myxozyma melibiosi]|uniref:K Homology domain-containing protein n=1 Tax=Myxozyma melibiosi TaxID=54550 RepID=A0ABR1FBL3_9ASCO
MAPTQTSRKRYSGPDDDSPATKRQARGTTTTTTTSTTSTSNGHDDDSSPVQLRCLIATREAAALTTGKLADEAAEISRGCGVQLAYSDDVAGAAERVLTVSGRANAVAKACSALALQLSSKQSPDTTTLSLRTIIPHKLLPSILDPSTLTPSGASLSASSTFLPLSTERTLLISGSAPALAAALTDICSSLADQSDRISTSFLAQFYSPLPMYGVYARPAHWRMSVQKGVATPFNPYALAPTGFSAADYAVATGASLTAQAAAVAATTAAASGSGAQDTAAVDSAARAQPVPSVQPAQSVQSAQQQAQHALPGQPLTQQIFIPNDMVGAIIGKGGSKINEIRQLSGSSIKINEPQENSNERLVTITGTTECNQMALYLLYSRLENEKHR